MKTKTRITGWILFAISALLSQGIYAQQTPTTGKPYEYRKTGTRYIVSLENGSQLTAALTDFVREQGIRVGSITGVGSINRAVLGFYNPAGKKYGTRDFSEQMQLANLTGNISTLDGEPYLNLNATLARADYSTIAGSLLSATVSGTAEVIVEDFGKSTVERSPDALTGLHLYDFSKPSPGIPIRAYPDAFWTSGKKEEVFNSNNDWTIYYADQDWVDFLVYQMVLVNKGYTYEGGTPDYVTAYLDKMAVGEVPPNPITLTLEKAGWMRQQITYYPQGAQSPGGMTYTMRSKLHPGQDLLSGKAGPSVPAPIYEPYGKHRDWLKEKAPKAAPPARQ